MLSLADVDLLARGGSVTLLALWSVLLLRDQRTALAARVAVAMNISIIAYVLSWRIWLVAPFSPLAFLTDILSVTAPALFWLFAVTWFTDAKRIGWRRWAIVLAFAALPVAQAAHIVVAGRFLPGLWLVVRIGMIGFGAAGLWIAWRGRDNDLVEPRRRFRSTLVWIIGAFVIWVSLVEIPFGNGAASLVIRSLTEIAILVMTFLVSAALYQFAQPQLFGRYGA